MNITYRNEGNILIPNLTVPKSPNKPIGTYGRMRKIFLKNYHPSMYSLWQVSSTSARWFKSVPFIIIAEYIPGW